MHLCKARGLRVCFEYGLPPDERAIRQELKPLSMAVSTGVSFWHLLLDKEIDGYIIEDARYVQKTFLMRYGKVPPMYWDDRPVPELRRYYQELCKLIDAENKLTTTVED